MQTQKYKRLNFAIEKQIETKRRSAAILICTNGFGFTGNMVIYVVNMLWLDGGRFVYMILSRCKRE